MKYRNAAEMLEGIPYTSTEKGRFFYNLVVENDAKDILELGFAHGCSASYFAAAAQELGGHVHGIDIKKSTGFKPGIEDLIERLGLQDTLTFERMDSSYTWGLHEIIKRQTVDGHCEPCFDLIFIDGPKDWTNDGAAFFMADKLLRQGGLLLIDDLSWTYDIHEANTGKRSDGYVFSTLSAEERAISQSREVFDLLISQHPSYGNFEIVDDIVGVARKSQSAARTMKIRTHATMKYRFLQKAKALLR